jgi:phospholipid/cholesterol/gamma-HCH transport system permease protein
MESVSKTRRNTGSLLKKSTAKVSKKIVAGKKKSTSFLQSIGEGGEFTWRVVKEIFRFRVPWSEFTRQCYLTGNKSLSLVMATGFIMGLVLTIQSRPVMAEFGAESWLPGMVGLSLVREMGPVITALIFAGKVGSGIGAELGSMKVTEQIDAMEVSGAEPFSYLVVSRVLACTFMVPLLVIVADVIGLTGSYVGVNIKGDVNLVLFFSRALETVDFSDLFPALVKSFLFGAAIGTVSCYKGYYASAGTESVGRAANSAVVVSSLMIFIIDALAVQITDLLFSA